MNAHSTSATVWCDAVVPSRECVRRALNIGRPVAFCVNGFGFDSYFEEGFVTLPGGDVVFFSHDTRGGSFERLCRHSDVAFREGYPECQRAYSESREIAPGGRPEMR
jgi:hypothetical protein